MHWQEDILIMYRNTLEGVHYRLIVLENENKME